MRKLPPVPSGLLQSALHLALSCGDTRAAQALLRVAPELATQRGSDGATALMRAAAGCPRVVLQTLLPLSDARAQNNEGWSALMFAAAAGREECVRALAPLSDLEAVNHEGHTALALARRNQHLHCEPALSPQESSSPQVPEAKEAKEPLSKWARVMARKRAQVAQEAQSTPATPAPPAAHTTQNAPTQAATDHHEGLFESRERTEASVPLHATPPVLLPSLAPLVADPLPVAPPLGPCVSDPQAEVSATPGGVAHAEDSPEPLRIDSEEGSESVPVKKTGSRFFSDDPVPTAPAPPAAPPTGTMTRIRRRADLFRA